MYGKLYNPIVIQKIIEKYQLDIYLNNCIFLIYCDDIYKPKTIHVAKFLSDVQEYFEVYFLYKLFYIFINNLL